MPNYEAADIGTIAQTPYSVLKVIGGWGNVSGPGLFMLRSMVAGTASASIVGVAASVIGATIWGTAGIPFLIGSSIGFTIGTLRWYVASQQEAYNNLHKYPSLMRLHLMMNFPTQLDFQRRDINWFRVERFQQNWIYKSMLVASWLTAKPALDEINTRLETALIESYTREAEDEESAVKSSPE